MARESMQFREGFSAQVVTGSSRKVSLLRGPDPKARHYVIGWMAISLAVALVAGIASWAFGAQEGVSLGEGFKTKVVKAQKQGRIGGVLTAQVIRNGKVITERSYKNQIINAGETALRDCFGGTGTPTCTTVQNFKFHGLGTSSAAIAETDTGCTTELTTQYNPDSTRATGSQTNNGANVYRTVATTSVDATVTVQEFCLMSQAATGGGTMWMRILTGGISLVSGDSVQTTYDLTIE